MDEIHADALVDARYNPATSNVDVTLLARSGDRILLTIPHGIIGVFMTAILSEAAKAPSNPAELSQCLQFGKSAFVVNPRGAPTLLLQTAEDVRLPIVLESSSQIDELMDVLARARRLVP